MITFHDARFVAVGDRQSCYQIEMASFHPSLLMMLRNLLSDTVETPILDATIDIVEDEKGDRDLKRLLFDQALPFHFNEIAMIPIHKYAAIKPGEQIVCANLNDPRIRAMTVNKKVGEYDFASIDYDSFLSLKKKDPRLANKTFNYVITSKLGYENTDDAGVDSNGKHRPITMVSYQLAGDNDAKMVLQSFTICLIDELRAMIGELLKIIDAMIGDNSFSNTFVHKFEQNRHIDTIRRNHFVTSFRAMIDPYIGNAMNEVSLEIKNFSKLRPMLDDFKANLEVASASLANLK